MELLPTGGELIVEAKLSPADIAVVRTGLPAALKLDAFDYSIYGTVRAEVTGTIRTSAGRIVFAKVLEVL